MCVFRRLLLSLILSSSASQWTCLLFHESFGRPPRPPTKRTSRTEPTNTAIGHRLFLRRTSSRFNNMESSILSSPSVRFSHSLPLHVCIQSKLVSNWRKGRRCALQEKKVEMQKKRIPLIPRCKPHYYGHYHVQW